RRGTSPASGSRRRGGCLVASSTGPVGRRGEVQRYRPFAVQVVGDVVVEAFDELDQPFGVLGIPVGEDRSEEGASLLFHCLDERVSVSGGRRQRRPAVRGVRLLADESTLGERGHVATQRRRLDPEM